MNYKIVLSIALTVLYGIIPKYGASQQYFSFQGGIGLGKVQFYENYHPVFLSGPENEDLFYTPSYYIAIRSTWPLSEYFDVALSFSHITVTSSKGAAQPAWRNFGEEGLTQGFIHLIPAVSYRPISNFTLTSGLRMGIANIFDPGNAKESSNSFLNSDIALTNQFMFTISQKFQLGFDWVEGLTYYDYFELKEPYIYYSFFKYRSFTILCQYDLNSKKHL